MKTKTILFGLLLGISFGLSSCYKDVILPDAVFDPDGPPQAVSYNVDVKPLLASKCTDPGCHVSGSHKPYLTADVSYLQIVNGGFVNLIIPKQSIIYQMINGDMKEHIPSAVDRQKVYDWIRTGALNN